VRQELGGLEPANCAFDQMADLLALLLGDSGSQVLDLNQPLPHEDHLGDIGDAGHPGVADQLRIQSKKSFRLFRVAARGRLPFQQAPPSVEFSPEKYRTG